MSARMAEKEGMTESVPSAEDHDGARVDAEEVRERQGEKQGTAEYWFSMLHVRLQLTHEIKLAWVAQAD